ncbi:DUF917 domain-containing protein [Microbacterium saperdae]|uniref:DUF917 domain-containing protein n=1 Tax=Microbacterium saperdae TaxID=69368 RepID=A0A543BI04_9MICO|nr:DUF917 domain-containing protein [Microbacterium saperdae]TQL84480.1 hypothetical protein FB560_0067 [Microbacterium saperdae]GGM60609.1 hypothetical protein GCM10010489_35220 [Microbacterium saperdae]
MSERRLSSITADVLPAIARGAAILGTGGGGDPYIGRLLAAEAIRQHGPIPLVDPQDLPDDAVVLPVALMGAPTVMVEKVPTVDQLSSAILALARYLGVTPTHVACIEVGGANSTIPMVAAAQLGLPLVDGDGMGRAFPEIQMVMPTLSGISCTPMSFADEKGNVGVVDTIDNTWAERLTRPVAVQMGSSMIVSNYAMTGAQVRESFIPHTLSLSHELGSLVEDARASLSDPVAAVVQRLGGAELLSGKVVDVSRRTVAGFARGEARIEGLDADLGHELVLGFQNEHLLATRNGTPIVSTPDLIMVLDSETGEPITTETLRYGQRVRVISCPSDERWHTEDGIALVGPRYFGYDVDPVRSPVTATAG